MKMPDNTVRAVKTYFKDELSSYFDGGEIESMFHIAMEHYFFLSKKDVLLDADRRLSESDLLKMIYCVKDLKKNKPLAYILGEWEFYGLKFKVNEHTLIPRPETEELVDLIVKENTGSLHLLDIGTGSGCIPISIKKHQPEMKIRAVDVSKEALSIAKYNAQVNQIEVDFMEYDILKNRNSVFVELFDVIVSNPPYVLKSDQQQMHPNVLDHEPHMALFVDDNDPLLFYNAIADFGLLNLKDHGKLYFEIHERYGGEVATLLDQKGFQEIEIIKDVNGKDRIVKAILIN